MRLACVKRGLQRYFLRKQRNQRLQLLPITFGQLGDVDCANRHNLAGTRDERLPIHVDVRRR